VDKSGGAVGRAGILQLGGAARPILVPVVIASPACWFRSRP